MMLVRASLLLAVLALILLTASVLPWPGEARGVTPDDQITTSSAEMRAYGKTLFSAKGCASCHYHVAVAGSAVGPGGPGGSPPSFNAALTADPAYLRAWLRDPQAQKPTTTMPNLGLSDAEITALIAFLRDAGATRP